MAFVNPVGRRAAEAWLALAALLLLGTAGTDLPLYRYNWWNFYERGVALLERGDFADARSDFETALGLRSGAKFGYDRDLWRAKTYGLHFIEGYFPHRELAVCLYHLGELDPAERHLEISLRQTPSGRARHYLNLVRERKLRGAQLAPPTIELDAASRAAWTRERRRVVAGTARADGFVSDLSVAGRRVFVELAEKALSFQEEIPLKAGANILVVECRDLNGRTGRAEATCVADWQPPGLAVRTADSRDEGWRLVGSCSDDGKLVRVECGGRVLYAGGADRRVVPVEIRGERGQPVLFEAEDAAGNELRLLLTEDGAARQAGHGAVRYASNEPEGLADVHPPAPAEADTLKPSLRLAQAAEVLDVYAEEYLVDGDAADGGGLAGITINGEQLMDATARGATRQYFLRRVALEPGTNVLRIVARDLAGNEASKALILVRREPEYLGDEHRLTLGVPPLVPGSNSASLDTATFQALIEQEILQDPPRFHLLERDEGWEFILREQQLSLSDLADPSAALRIGKMLPAELLLMGRLFAIGDGLTVHARVVETATGRIVGEHDVYTESAKTDLPYQVSGLVMKIEQLFPLAEGKVVDARGGQATIDLGAARGIKVGTRFIAVRTAEDGSVCKSGEQVVELKVSRVEKDKARAQVLPSEGTGLLTPGVMVYTR